jgi:hypothetical protein
MDEDTEEIKYCLRWPCPAIRGMFKDEYVLTIKCTEEDWRKCPFTTGGNKVEQKV